MKLCKTEKRKYKRQESIRYTIAKYSGLRRK